MATPLGKTYETIRSQVERLDNLMMLVIVVLFIGFITLLVTVCGLVITYQDNSRAANQDLRDQVKTQSDNIQRLTTNMESLTKAIQSQQTASH